MTSRDAFWRSSYCSAGKTVVSGQRSLIRTAHRALGLVLAYAVLDGLPLHVSWLIGTTSAQWSYVVHDPARACAAGLSGRRTRMFAHEGCASGRRPWRSLNRCGREGHQQQKGAAHDIYARAMGISAQDVVYLGVLRSCFIAHVRSGARTDVPALATPMEPRPNLSLTASIADMRRARSSRSFTGRP